TILLLLQLPGLLADEFAEIFARLLDAAASLLHGLLESLIQLIHLVALAFRLGAHHAEGGWLGRGRLYCRGVCGRRDFGAFGFNGLGRGSKVALYFSLFLLLEPLAENVFVLRVSLREVVVAETLTEFHLAAALAIALDDRIDAPFDFGGRALPAAAEILVVFDLEL